MDALVNLQCGVKNRHIRAENGDMLLDSLGPGSIIQRNTLGENNAANITQGSNSQCIDIPHDCDPYAVFRCLAHGNAQQVTAEKSGDVAVCVISDIDCLK